MRFFNVFFLLILANFSSAQNANESLTNMGRVNVGFYGVELSYEMPVLDKVLWENNVGIGAGAYVRDNDAGYTLDLVRPVPFIKSQLKYMYNLEKRRSNGRITKNNSGNYIGLQAKYMFGNSNSRDLNPTLLSELHWGIQRAMWENFTLNLHIGLGYLSDFDNNEGSITSTVGLRFGYRFFN